jgi:hypothetical protein
MKALPMSSSTLLQLPEEAEQTNKQQQTNNVLSIKITSSSASLSQLSYHLTSLKNNNNNQNLACSITSRKNRKNLTPKGFQQILNNNNNKSH